MQKKCIIYISSTNYKIVSAGTEKFMSGIIEAYKEKEVHSIQIFPMVNINGIFEKLGLKKIYLGINCDGEFVGAYLLKNAIGGIEYICKKNNFSCSGVIINQLHNWDLNQLSALLCVLELPIYIVIHDYMMICPYLMSEDGNGLQCGLSINRPSELHCVQCKYCNEELNYFACMNSFLEKIEFLLKRIIFPSISARNNWMNAFEKYLKYSVVRPHLIFSTVRIKRQLKKKIKIAYLGYISDFKGYSEWKKLIQNLDRNYFEFYYFGSYTEKAVNDGVNAVLVDFNRNDLIKMAQQLRNNDIDIVFLWSNCQETYSYTYYEALEAGCFVITSTHSGNITDQVRQNRNGICFENIKDCIKYLSNLQGEIESLQAVDIKNNTDLGDFTFDNTVSKNTKNIKAKKPCCFISLLYKKMRRPKSENKEK